MKYKRYEVFGGKPPRSTAFYRKKKIMNQMKAELEQLKCEETFPSEVQVPVGVESLVDLTVESQCAPNLSSTSSSECEVTQNDQLTSRPRLKQRRRKQALDGRRPCDGVVLSSSESEEPRDSDEPGGSDMSTHSTSSQLSARSEEAESVLSDCSNIQQESVCSDAFNELEESEIEEEPWNMNAEPLCPCTTTTLDDIFVMTLTLGVRHGLSWAAQTDILKMIRSLYPGKKLAASKYLYLKKVDQAEKHITHHVFCNVCTSYLGPKGQDKNYKKCSECDINVSVSKVSNFFISLSIEAQLKKFMEHETFVRQIMHYRFEKPSDPNVLSDVYDGAIYRKLSADGGLLSSPFNFSYTFFTDGVAFGKSSKKTIWPIYLTINELPYRERSRYFILAGVYVGCHDPDQNYFLQPFVTEANRLSTEGFTWTYKKNIVKSLVIPLCCVLDSVARYQMLHFQSFNAKWGCTFCYKKSSHTTKGHRFLVSAPAERRTHPSLIKDLKEVYKRKDEASESERVYRGVKGASNLMSLKFFSITECVVVDYMHALLVGVTKLHLVLMLESTRKKMWIGMTDNIGIAHLVNSIDQRMKRMQSSSSVIRVLRSLKDHALWKASEYRSWLLFYCVPCLTGLLKEKYVLHWCMLSAAAALILKKSVTLNEVAEAHRLFMLYTFHFQQYFGEENMVYNVHLLSHICEGVINFGPVWGHNSFLYESQNHYLLQLCKSHSSVALEIARKYLVYQSLPLLYSKFPSTRDFAKKILDFKMLVKCVRTDDECVMLGREDSPYISKGDQDILFQCIAPSDPNLCVYYQRCIYKKHLYSINAYCLGKQNNDSCLSLQSGKIGIINHIIRTPTNNVVFIIKSVNLQTRAVLQNKHVSLRHIKKVHSYGESLCVDVESVAGPCIILDTTEGPFVSKIPYGCTVE